MKNVLIMSAFLNFKSKSTQITDISFVQFILFYYTKHLLLNCVTRFRA